MKQLDEFYLNLVESKATFKVIQEYLLKDREKENGYGKYFKEK